jgi:primary-amine oxidase
MADAVARMSAGEGLSAVDPLRPLAAAELETAASVVAEAGLAGAPVQFVSISLREPAKAEVLAWRPGDRLDRQALVVVRRPGLAGVTEAVVSISRRRLLSVRGVPGVQAPLLREELRAAAAPPLRRRRPAGRRRVGAAAGRPPPR